MIQSNESVMNRFLIIPKWKRASEIEALCPLTLFKGKEG